jgi:hypothetical protein
MEFAMTNEDLPSPDLLRKLLRYDPDTGKLFWVRRTPDMFSDEGQRSTSRCARWNSRYAEKEAFTSIGSGGYRIGKIFKKHFLAHRVIWAMQNGHWPKDHIDHVSGDRTDNRIENIRDAGRRENNRNQKRRSDNTSGVTGVSFMKQTGKWTAYINSDAGFVYLGVYSEKAAAISARRKAEKRIGYHKNHGRVSCV